jgi:hypothetical protein
MSAVISESPPRVTRSPAKGAASQEGQAAAAQGRGATAAKGDALQTSGKCFSYCLVSPSEMRGVAKLPRAAAKESEHRQAPRKAAVFAVQ